MCIKIIHLFFVFSFLTTWLQTYLTKSNKWIWLLMWIFIEGDWINNTTYCNGKDSECTSELIVTVPKISLSSPGVVRHDYPNTEAPVTPQVSFYSKMTSQIFWDFGLRSFQVSYHSCMNLSCYHKIRNPIRLSHQFIATSIIGIVAILHLFVKGDSFSDNQVDRYRLKTLWKMSSFFRV